MGFQQCSCYGSQKAATAEEQIRRGQHITISISGGLQMRENDFEAWLEESYITRNGNRLQKRPRSDAKSRCKRVEKYEGDLDIHFADDRMAGLLNTLAYSRADEASGTKPQHTIPIDGNIFNGTASLRSAIKLYQQFRMQS